LSYQTFIKTVRDEEPYESDNPDRVETEPFLDEDRSGIKPDDREEEPQVYPPFLVSGMNHSEGYD
jgi:hypothetical protein